MNLKELREIIDIVTSQDSIEELELEKSGVRLRIKRSNHQAAPVFTAPVPPPSASVTTAIAASAPAASAGVDVVHIKSPIVGTFYHPPSPTDDPYVKVGDVVRKGSPVCIIEAMKLMNEIESEVSGEIVAVLVENGQPVEYGENLFAVRPR